MAVEGGVAEPDQIQHHDRNRWIGFAEQLPLLVGTSYMHGGSLRTRRRAYQLTGVPGHETSSTWALPPHSRWLARERRAQGADDGREGLTTFEAVPPGFVARFVVFVIEETIAPGAETIERSGHAYRRFLRAVTQAHTYVVPAVTRLGLSIVTDTEIYNSTKAEVVAYMQRLPAESLTRRCDYCPDWSLKDVLAHHIHALRTIATGNSIPPPARTAIIEPEQDRRSVAVKERNKWTQSGVDDRQSSSLNDLCDEWSDVVGMMTKENAFLVLDLSVHYDDIRETIEGQVARSGADLPRSLELFHGLQAHRLRKAGCNPVALLPSDTPQRIGDGAAPAAAGTTYDLLRVLASRRTRHEAASLVDWGAIDRDTIDAFPVYGWPDEPGGG